MTQRPVRIGLPLLWAIGAVVVGLLGAISEQIAAHQLASASLQDTTYFVAHGRYTLSLAAAYLAFALICWVAERVVGTAFNRRLGLVQFGLMAIGTLMMFGPQILLGLRPPQHMADYIGTFRWMNLTASIGYMLSLAGVAVFVIMVIEMLIRRHKLGQRAKA